MKINTDCILCSIAKMDRMYDQYDCDPMMKLDFMKDIYALASHVGGNETAPLLSAKMLEVLQRYSRQEDPYRENKSRYNQMLLRKEKEILERIEGSEDSLEMAIKFAMVGNFIDFGAMDDVDVGMLTLLIQKAPTMTLSSQTMLFFRSALESARQMLYIGDNAGEIVLDKLFIVQLKKFFPAMKIIFMVRGKPVFNDVTRLDAEEVGLERLVELVDNGTGIPGTQLDKIQRTALHAIHDSDFILAKGQGNFETLAENGLNVFYLFLCKCDLFTRRFGLQKYEGVFTHEHLLAKDYR